MCTFALCAQKVTVITKIVIIKKYSCEGDGWSCKGSDYCDVRPAACLVFGVWCLALSGTTYPALCASRGAVAMAGPACAVTTAACHAVCHHFPGVKGPHATNLQGQRLLPRQPPTAPRGHVGLTLVSLASPPICASQGGKHWGCPEGTKCDPNWDGKGGELASWDSAFLLGLFAQNLEAA